MSRIAKASSTSALFLGLGLMLGVLLIGAQLVFAEPGPNFTVTPEAPLPGETVTFAATDLRGSDTVRWDFNGDGAFDATGATVRHVFTTPGERTVRMRVTRQRGDSTDVTKVVRVDGPPTASFTASPNPATAGETVQFNASGSSDPDGSIASYAWDLDNDGQFDDASGVTASRSFPTAGSYTIRLRVTDNRGAAGTAASVVTVNSPANQPPPTTPPPTTPPPASVANQPPVGSFTFSPRSPLTDDPVQLTSTSTDVEGPIASYAWDLDDDGQFDDAFARTPVVRFAKPGSHPVSLRVTDVEGAVDIASRVIVVGARPASATSALVLMRPFPIVRIVGRSTGSGARIKLLAVRSAPPGARVTVRCRGRGCPVRRPRSKYVRSTSVRIRSFERRVRAGARIQVFVTQPGKLGKYTSFKIRRTRPPLRRDLCVTAVGAKPQRCPMS